MINKDSLNVARGQSKTLTLSLVIPVYNEENHIKACLDAVAAQTTMPDEVIVIDNNSTDRTVEIAKSYPFVKLIHEPKQGLIAARNAGFALATGDIFGRIDADAQIEPDWTIHVKAGFMDKSVDGMSGPARTTALVVLDLFTTLLWSRIYFIWYEAYLGTYILWGANMAIRRSAWEKIKPYVCLDDTKVHEDQDILFLIISRCGRVVWNSGMQIYTAGEEYHYWPKFYEYNKRAIATKKLHRKDMRTAHVQSKKLNAVQRCWRWAVVLLPGFLFVTTSIAEWGAVSLIGRYKYVTSRD